MKTKTITVADFGRIVTGKTPPTKDKDNYGGTIQFITPVDMTGNRSIVSSERYISIKGLKAVKNCYLPEHAVCVSCIGSDMGKAVLTTAPSITNQQINSIVVDEDSYDYMYVYYLMRTLEEKIKSLGKNATAVPILNKTKFSNIEVQVPEIDVQKRIASVLSAYDDLIENNQKQIKLLEEAAQRLYKEWFVDLRFPGHEHTAIVDGVPEGWRTITVSDSLQFYIGGGWGKETPSGKNTISGKVIRGTDINDIKNGNYSDIPFRFHSINDISKRKLQEYDIIFELSNGNINNIGRTLLISKQLLEKCGENTICASFCKLFRPKNKDYSLILLLEIQDMQYSGRMSVYKKQGSNGINNFAFEDFLNHSILIPESKKILVPFEKIENEISNLQVQIHILIEARDRLLPKLMNGEMEV